jgi:HEAT repeat protein
MDLPEIEKNLNNSDYQFRLKAVSALREYGDEIAVPLLVNSLQDGEFLVRTFAARELGRKQTAESFAALLQTMQWDNTPNVRAEAANSLSLFGRVSAAHLVTAFVRDDHWLLRRSILAAIVDLECHPELLEICRTAIDSDDPAVHMDVVYALGRLSKTELAPKALDLLLVLVDATNPWIRTLVARSLHQFDFPSAKLALERLRQDPNSRVVAATWEGTIAAVDSSAEDSR